jgi:hypothetical protein
VSSTGVTRNKKENSSRDSSSIPSFLHSSSPPWPRKMFSSSILSSWEEAEDEAEDKAGMWKEL